VGRVDYGLLCQVLFYPGLAGFILLSVEQETVSHSNDLKIKLIEQLYEVSDDDALFKWLSILNLDLGDLPSDVNALCHGASKTALNTFPVQVTIQGQKPEIEFKFACRRLH
jgi:hypothetical protein